MSSKEKILNALRSSGATLYPKPDLSALEAESLRYEDPLAQFCEAVKTAGGRIGGDYPEDSVVVDGLFGVAENGAVWLEPDSATRPSLFTPESLVIRVPKAEIVNNMHEAYLRLGEERKSYGIFISGPSKTADIEQALVFGAHGARSVTVILV